jgi:hypothetical protein
MSIMKKYLPIYTYGAAIILSGLFLFMLIGNFASNDFYMAQW